MAIRYTHTNIIAQDWKRLAAFYQNVFGCTVVPPERNQSGRWLARGTGVPDAALAGVHLRLPGYEDDGPTLEIYTYAAILDNLPPHANRKGFGHIAFEVDDVAHMCQAILAAGGSQLGEVVSKAVAGVGTITFVYMTDPEGNILEIQHWS